MAYETLKVFRRDLVNRAVPVSFKETEHLTVRVFGFLFYPAVLHKLAGIIHEAHKGFLLGLTAAEVGGVLIPVFWISVLGR